MERCSLTRRKWRPAFLITCEHGGNRVPAKYAALFAPHRELLKSHRGWDPGSLELGRAFARALRAPLIVSTTTRLLVELNRSERHRSLFSAITRSLPDEERQHILERWYHPHRRRVIEHVRRGILNAGAVFHLAMHTFTPVLDGLRRTTDIGLLFDPSRALERRFCTRWQDRLREARPDLTIHRNQPYRGVSDGLGTSLRRFWPDSKYVAVELEVNQKFALGSNRDWRQIIADLVDACRASLDL